MKEHPISYKTPMVKAYLEDRKCMTRRILKPQPIDVIPMPNPQDGWVALTEKNPNHGKWIKYRYGQVGDVMWVRESFFSESGDIYYKADWENVLPCAMVIDKVKIEKWKPAIFMPRWASRLTQTITGIRVERLQDITDTEAMREGVDLDTPYDTQYKNWRQAFSFLWNGINLKRGYSWESNPFVWVISYPKYSEEPSRK